LHKGGEKGISRWSEKDPGSIESQLLKRGRVFQPRRSVKGGEGEKGGGRLEKGT